MIPTRSLFVSTLRKQATQQWAKPATFQAVGNRFMSTDPNAYATNDGYFEKSRLTKEEGNQRDFTYFLLGTNRFVMATAARAAAIKVSLGK